MTTDSTAASLGPAMGLVAAYAPGLPVQDEMLEPAGGLRPQWQKLVGLLDELGPAELMSRWDWARRLIRENGITHNVYDNPDGLARPWNLDLLPLLLAAAEWQTVSAALVQRARLLNAILADLYGPATSVSSGLLPPELVYDNGSFLRACHGQRPPLGQWLHLYAADLLRAPDGQFRVLSDGTQSPSGAGYSLENRIVLTRVLPTVFQQCNVLRLAPFFITLRQNLAALAPVNRENPRVVVLTPGPYNEAYFEHAYLARYLGYALVQGKDLTVRDCKVYLKTLGGLQRVDVILRRVDDDYCDPLEMYPQSFLGVPGLLQAVRDGTVAVANALGSGALQGPAFLPFLPGLCRHFLNEDLKLPSVETWWCGHPDSRNYVLNNLSSLVIKPAFPTRGTDPVFGGELSPEERDALARRIRARPRQFVAQQRIASFMAPVLLSGQVQSRRFVLRAYLAAEGNSYAVMPGGLTRFTSTRDSLVVSLQRGGGSKDTWILGEGPVSQVSLLASPSAPVALSRGGGDLSSRVADDLFWLGRYATRSEAVVRLARCVFNRLADPNALESPLATNILMRELVGWVIAGRGPAAARELAVAMFSARDPSGLRRAASRLHAMARVLRDRISTDAWRILQAIDRDLADFNANVDEDEIAVVFELFNQLITSFLAFGGMAADSMTRGQSWRFLDIGLRLERAISAARLVRMTLVDKNEEEASLLDALLETGDSSLTYRRRYLTQLEVPAVVDLLIADETNPRSTAYQIVAIDEHLSHLPRESMHPQRNPDQQLTQQLRTLLRLTDLSCACSLTGARRPGLDTLMATVIDLMGTLSDVLSRSFFSHASATPHLLTPDQELRL
ncbi:MAG TPA: circularly permuted type 2 ATP-grasp protein [Pirellulales bacterium]|nr:circularly permuted type 2 ATP-grasp protein [Pirellulales bacterium]